MRRWLLLSTVVLASLLAPLTVLAAAYSVTTVFIYNSKNIATAVNDAGFVVGEGYGAGPDGFIFGYLWNGMQVSFTEYPEGIHDNSFLGVNASGTVVGYGVFGPLGEAEEMRAIMGTPPQLEEIAPTAIAAHDINDAGQIVGICDVEGSVRGFLFEEGVLTVLGTLGGDESRPAAINASGLIVGESKTAGNAQTRAFQLAPGGQTLEDLGTLGGDFSAAFDVNDAGVAVGWSRAADGVAYPAVFSGGSVTQLGSIAGRALAVNNGGVVVGMRNGNGAFRSVGGVVQDLNELIPANSGWVLWRATDINDAGVIVGWGDQTVNGIPVQRGFMLTPTPVGVEGPTRGRLALTAIPTVTSGATRFAFGRPLSSSARLILHDVSGRRIREMAIDAGAADVTWDGRDDHGRPAPIGALFARLLSADGDAGARIAVVR